MLLAGSSHAEAASVARLEWLEPPPPGCLDQSLVERTVESRLGEPVFTYAPDALQIRGRFSEVDGRPRVQLEIVAAAGEPLGERELAADSCAQLQSSLPVVIAVLLDLGAETVPHAPEPVLAPPTAAPAALPPAAAEPEPEPPAVSRRYSLALLAEAVTGIQPRIGLGAGLDAAVQLLGPLQVSVWGALRLPSELAGTPSVEVRSLSTGLSLCLVSGWLAPLRAGACAGGGVLSVWAAGRRGFSSRADDASLVGEVRGLGHLEYPIAGPLRARADFGIVIPTERVRYGFEDETPVYRLSIGVIGRLGVAFGW